MTLQGHFVEIIFNNPDNGYTVGLFAHEDELTMCVGYLPGLTPGEELELTGGMAEHPKYGVQFKVESYKYLLPSETDAMYEFLSSGTIEGVGPALAERILMMFGELSFDILEHDPQRLQAVPGIGPKTLKRIVDSYQTILERRDSLMFLQQLGLGPQRTASIITRYGTDTRQVIEENPYRLYLDFPQVGFQTIDTLASKLGFERDHEYRIHAYVLHLLIQYQDQGHVFADYEQAKQRLARELMLDEERIEDRLRSLIGLGHLFVEDGRLYLQQTYRAETFLAMDLSRLAHAPMEDLDYKEIIDRFCQRYDITLDIVQWEALETIATHPVSVITGGPGTGKTTLIRGLCHLAEKLNLKLLLAAPTGRAAKRMEETTGHPAATIHRLLEYKFSEDEQALFFERSRLNPLETDILIIDEVSMVDVFLMASLLEAVESGTRLILIGDANQLASVGPGKVLHDVIDSGSIPTTNLLHIFRQSEHSLIPENAARVIAGSREIHSDNQGDFFIMRTSDTDETKAKLAQLITNRLPEYYGFDPVWDIQVLTPMRKGPVGTHQLNELIQSLLIDPSRPDIRGFRVGDKIMQTKNDYTLAWRDRQTFDQGVGVFNGDIGEVIEVDTRNRRLVVVFDKTREVEYTADNLNQLELAYAMTIHKSQGSEFPCVIIVLGYVPGILNNRNVIYTGITRARQLLIVLGSMNSLYQMIEHVDSFERNTYLSERLVQDSQMRQERTE